MNLPGWVDLQVNGLLGTNFSDPQLTVPQVIASAQCLAQQGTTAFCPTVTTSPLATYERVLPVLAAAADTDEGRRHILGVHLEGPFISSAEGAVGVHPAAYVQTPDVELFEHLWSLCAGKLSIITLAPELPGASGVIRAAVKRGVKVAIGHTLCATQDVTQAVSDGATLCTHLGNGCPGMLNRHHNPLWAQLDSPLATMLIADGQHLPVSVLRTFIRAKGTGKIIITSDMSPVAGLPPGNYTAFGHAIRITEGGRIENCEAPTLAGSSSTLLECINHLARNGFADRQFLQEVGFLNPLAALGKKPQDILGTEGLEWNGNAFSVKPTIRRG